MENASSIPPQKPHRTRTPRCSMPGCRMKNTSTHYFPKSLERCSQWIAFVQKYKPDFGLSPWSCICGGHFEMKCFTQNFMLEEKMGCHRIRRNLNEEAVPTLFDSSMTSAEGKTTTAESKPSTPIDTSPGAVDRLLNSVPLPANMRIRKPSIPIDTSPGAVDRLLNSVPLPANMRIRKIAPKKNNPREVRPKPVLLKGKLFGPFDHSQTPLLLVPQGSSFSPGVSGSSTKSTNLALALPVTIGSGNQMPQKLINIITTSAQTFGGNVDLATQKRIVVKKKVIPKRSIVPLPIKEETEQKKTTFTLQQLKSMSSEDLVTLFSYKVKIALSKNYALRCRMGGNCPFVISCPSENDCRSVMSLHLKKHIDWWIVGTAGNPLISTQLTFESGEPLEENHSAPNWETQIKKIQSPVSENVPCISETTEEEPERNEILQTAFRKLCETIAAEMNQIKVESDRLEALLEDEQEKNPEVIYRETIGTEINRVKMGSDRIEALLRDEAEYERREQEERKRKLFATLQSPRKHLIPVDKLRIMNRERLPQDAQSVNLVLRPLAGFTNLPRILARSRKPVSADELDMPVITAVRGSVRREEEGDGVESENKDAPVARGPSPFGIANEMIAKAKAVFDGIGTSHSRTPEGLPSRDLNSESTLRPFVDPSSPALEKFFSPPRLSDVANRVLLNECEMRLPSPQDSEKEFDMREDNLLDSMSSGSLEPPPDDADDIMQGIHESEQSGTPADLEIVDVDIPIPSCWKKEAFLYMLGLQKIAHENESQEKLRFVTKPLFRTRRQKKAAVLQKFYQKRNAAIAPKRVEVNLKPVKTEPPDEIPESVFENTISNENQEYDDPVPETYDLETNSDPSEQNSQDHIQNRSLFSRLKQPAKSNLYKGFNDIVGYQVRRADLLKKRAREQTKSLNIKKEFMPDVMNDDCVGVWPENNDEQDFERDESHYLVSEVLRMPEEGMLEVYKDDQKSIRELEEDEAERKMSRQIKILRKRREKLTEERVKKEEDEQKKEDIRRGSIPVKDLLPPEKLVLKRKFIAIPDRVLHNSKQSKKSVPSSREIIVNGTVVTIKQEALLDQHLDEERDSDVESFDEGGYSSEENKKPEHRKSKLSVYELLRQRRRFREVDFSGNNKANDDFDSTDSEKGKNENSSDNESLDEEEIDWDLNLGEISFYEKKAHSNLPDKIMPETQRETEDLSVSEQDEMVMVSSRAGFPNDSETPNNSSERSESNNQDAFKRANFAPPAVLTETELKIREKALEYLRRLKILERQRSLMVEAGETLPERDLKFTTCKICSRTFNSLSSIYYHYRSHAGVKPFKCDTCFKSFTRLHSLNYHKMIHADKTRFQCRYCGKGFRHPSHYKEHLNKHTGEEPFKCRECSRRFRTSNSLRRHLRTQHGLKTTVRIGDHMPTIEELEKIAPVLSPPASPQAAMQSKSPALPESHPASECVPSSNMRPIRLTLFPKNGLSRVCFAGEETREQK